MIRNLDRAVFESELKRTLSPSSPIRTPEFLRGREKNLEQIRRAFVQPGRQVFIYGDRGVGKTSLALTAAGEHSLGRAAPILLNCRGGFFGIIQDLLNRISDRSVLSPKETENSEFSIANMVGFKKNKAREKVYVANVRSINDVVTALKELYSSRKSGQVVVFDEFELVDPPEERRLFGDFIKAISDQEVPLKAVFCGISDSVNSLLDNHPSAPRYLSAVELSRLSYEARFEIMRGAENALGVEIEYNTRWRIASISDGFPHYIHLICEKLFWEMFTDEEQVTNSTVAHYKAAVTAAVEDAQPHLRSIYDFAVKKYQRDYEHILWAAADHPNLERRSIDIFESYRALITDDDVRLTRERFNQRLNALKQKSHGEVLLGTRQGWYRFRESMLRGYARLRAEEEGVQLMVDHPLASRSAR